MRRALPFFGVLGIIAAASLMAAPALAAGTLDQHQDNTDDHLTEWNSGFQVAQTFRADLTGTLDTVSLFGSVRQYDAAEPSPGVNVEIAIWPVDGATGHPDQSDDPLVWADVHFGGTQAWTDVVLDPAPAVEAHTYYAIVAQVTSGRNFNWAGKCDSDLYEYGSALVDDGEDGWMTVVYRHDHYDVADWECQADFAFRTYVTEAGDGTPTPAGVRTPTARPTTTPPPTAAGNSSQGGIGTPVFVILLAVAAVAAAVAASGQREIER